MQRSQGYDPSADIRGNQKGQFKNISANTGIQNQIGWWNTIQSGDFDKDGDMDYIVGNLGMNSFYRATDTYPVAIYAKDFDNNDSYDAFPALYLPTSHTDTIKKLYPADTFTLPTTSSV